MIEPGFHLLRQSRIYIGPVEQVLPDVLPRGRVVVVTDAAIDRLYPDLLAPYKRVLIGMGESAKTLQTVETVYRRFIELGVDRSTFVLGIGGGIVTDVTGFAAATYMRGIPFGFVPTTLLGQVDASLGGKNGVNVDGYKNMAGTFIQPRFVVCDPAMLRTLSDREFRAGLAEAVKAGIIADGELFRRIGQVSLAELRTDTDLLSAVLRSAIRVKVDLVEKDEKEAGERRKLNLGHTLAHAVEKCSDRMNHGEAVAVGMALIASAAVKLGVLTADDRDRIVRVLRGLGFELTPPVAVKRLLAEVAKDKKNENGMLHVVLPAGIGDCVVRTMSQGEFARLFDA